MILKRFNRFFITPIGANAKRSAYLEIGEGGRTGDILAADRSLSVVLSSLELLFLALVRYGFPLKVCSVLKIFTVLKTISSNSLTFVLIQGNYLLLYNNFT